MARQTLHLKLGQGDLVSERWTVVKKLGAGGCGSVYFCRHKKDLDQEVAVKVLENASDIQRFNRERKVLRGIRHSKRGDRPTHIVRYIDSGTHDRFPYLVMEYMPGGSLRDLLDDKGKLPVEDAAWALVMTVRGLRASKTFHRDLKPENLLLSKSAGGGPARIVAGDGKQGAKRKGSLLKVADFGLAKKVEGNSLNLTKSGQIMGTPLYMSPEQCRNTRDVGVGADIYSLGVMLFEMVVGRPPFEAENAYDLMAQHCNDEPKYPKSLDPDVRKVLERCLAKKPKDRFQSLIALERELCKLAGLGEPEPDRGWIVWVIILGGLVLMGLLGWLLSDRITANVGAWLQRLF